MVKPRQLSNVIPIGKLIKEGSIKKSGFTLIEMVVTLGVIIIISVISFGALTTQQQRGGFDAAVSQLKDAILSTQTFALAPNHEDAASYTFTLSGDATTGYSYTIVRTLKSGALFTVTSADINDSVNITTLPPAITYTVGSATIGQDTDIDIAVTNLAGEQTRHIIILAKTGAVQVN